ncbi:MAG: hypothetical protein KVP17_001126 [Porospora cf. gigantea B]|uniref:uncharacterized protein n=1 Tax=Porospora cf. gigantea B TaxID=2853592 RepID=UPI0035717B90|nr:MAG: hypothetical protein KVP17_001126 [Porospora cf. gigantea B]
MQNPLVDYRMTLYLHEDVTADDLMMNAAVSNVTGVKLYPRGVTTNSEQGVGELEASYPIFDAMYKAGLALHVHGEEPGTAPAHAEAAFLPRLQRLAGTFPHLRIVLEHVSTAEGIEVVKSLGNVAGTLTPQHLLLTRDDVFDGDCVRFANFCKPLAKTNADRDALRGALCHSRFFLGSDSAPHTAARKRDGAAGCFPYPHVLSHYAAVFDELDLLRELEPFACERGANFFGIPPADSEATGGE